MKNFTKTLVYSNVWVGLAVASFCFLTMVDFTTINMVFLAFVICATVFTYNYMRLVQVRGYDLRNPVQFKAWIAGHRREVWLLTLISGALSFYFFLKIYRPDVIWLLLLPGLVSLVYPLSFQRAFTGFTSLRTVPGLKMFLIAASWSYVTVLVPVLLYSTPGWENIIEMGMRTLLVLGLVIPFDIRDEAMDDPEMRTLPQVLGVAGARQLAIFFVMLYQIWVVLRFFIFDSSLVFSLALLVGLEVGYWLIRYTSPRHGEEYFSFWIEGVPVLCAVLVIVAKLLVNL